MLRESVSSVLQKVVSLTVIVPRDCVAMMKHPNAGRVQNAKRVMNVLGGIHVVIMDSV